MRVLHIFYMKSTIATSICVALFTVGFAIGCLIWAAIGWGIGSLVSDAPVSGALTGLAYQLWSVIYLREQMAASIERNIARFEIILGA